MQFWLFESGLDWTCSPALRNADRTDIWWKSREFACSMRFDDDRNGQIDYIESLGNGHMNIWNIHLKTPRHKHWRRPPWHGRVLFYYFLLCPCPLRVFQGFFFSGVERAKRQEHLRGVGTSELVARQPVEHGSEPCDVSGDICNACPRTLLCETVILAKVLAAHFPSREPRGLWWIFLPSMEVFWASIGHQTGYRFSVHTTRLIETHNYLASMLHIHLTYCTTPLDFGG